MKTTLIAALLAATCASPALAQAIEPEVPAASGPISKTCIIEGGIVFCYDPLINETSAVLVREGADAEYYRALNAKLRERVEQLRDAQWERLLAEEQAVRLKGELDRENADVAIRKLHLRHVAGGFGPTPVQSVPAPNR